MVQDDEIVELAAPVTVTYVGVFSPATTEARSAPMLQLSSVASHAGASAYHLGMKDLVSEVENQVVGDTPLDRTLPTFTREFVASCIEFGDVPSAIREAVCQDIIDFSHAFSWNAFDLGCITDVPHRVIRIDHSAAVHPSRRHLYTPSNEAILHAKCDPYIEMGIFQPASTSCKDRAQLTIVRTGLTDRNDPKYCRVAHDFRAMNSRIQLDPEPVDSVPDMLAWMGVGPTGLFFKTDADRGFYQIVCAADDNGESINSTCFELFHRLWVSTRMLFGQKNGPATFKRNAMIMQEELLAQGKTKSYFDDIIGKAFGVDNDFEGLRRTWRRLLELAAKHGWKFKPAKTKWGFSKIETVGFEWSLQGIGVGQKMTNAVRNLVFPRTKSELRGLLGLANQFRERIAGYALLVTALTALTRGPERQVVATPEALIEFENLKVALNSTPVLQQFRYDRPTFVYTDVSVGSRGGADNGFDIPGGLGVVIVQTDEDGCDYVCAYASAGLTPAQHNYHIVRLELLAFVFACGKFFDWLAGIQFVWRSDCRAHEFLHAAKTSPNPTIARYALTLAEFNFTVEWIPGLTMIADSFSRLMLAPCSAPEAISLPEIVFGVDMGKRIQAAEPLLLFVPGESLVVDMPLALEIEDELDGWISVDVVGHAEVPVTKGTSVDSLDLTVLYDVPLFVADESVVAEDSIQLEELGVWPGLTVREVQKMRALIYLRRWVNKVQSDSIPPECVHTLNEIGKKVWIEDDKLWKVTRRGMRVEVLDTAGRLREVLLLCHEGMGHRQLGSVYEYFSRRYWVPAAIKFIKRHILACTVCQQFASDVSPPQAFPGFSPSTKDVFTHWSVDFAGPFPTDAATGHRYIIVAVEWATRWAEAETVIDATAAVAAEFIYSRLIARYGCIQCIQSDRGPHFVNGVISCLAETLGIRHKLSTPYYPQSNGKVERVIGTLKSMLRRTVAAAAQAQRPAPFNVGEGSNGIKVFGVGLDLDDRIVDAITKATCAQEVLDVASSGNLDDIPVVECNAMVHWSPLLHTVLWVYRSTPHSVTGLSPALLALGRELPLPMDISTGPGTSPDVAPLTDDEHKAIIAKRLRWITERIEGLQELRYGRRDSVCTARFELGQKVWKREPKFDGKGFVPVFAPRWTGPYIIHSVYDKNVYKLRTIPDGQKKAGYLKNPINGSRLKPFMEDESKFAGGTVD